MMDKEMSILLAEWKDSSFDDKAVQLDRIIKDVDVKLISRGGNYVINEMREDLKLIKGILEKFDEEEKRIKVYCYVHKLRCSRLNKRALEILCELLDMVNSSKKLKCKDKRWMNKNGVSKLDKKDLLRAIKNCKSDEHLYEHLLNSRGIDLPKKDFMEITSRLIHKKIYEYQAMNKKMERLECVNNLREIPYAVSETRQFTFHGYKSILEYLSGILETKTLKCFTNDLWNDSNSQSPGASKMIEDQMENGEDSEIDSKLEKMHGLMEQEISPDIGKVLVTGAEVKEAMMDSKVSPAEISPSHTEAFITREVNEGLSVHPENAQVDVEKLSELVVEDSVLLKPELGLVADCCKVIVHENNNEEVHLSPSKSGSNADSIVPEEQVHGDNLQQEEVTSKMVVQEVIVEGRADIAVAMDIVDNGVESLPDNTNVVPALSQSEKDEIDVALGVQELHCGQQDQSSNFVPEADSVVSAGSDTITSPSDAVNIIAACEDEAKVDYPNVSVTSREVAGEESFTNPTEESPVVAVCPTESVENLIHEERNLADSGGSGVVHSCAENSEVKESTDASVNVKVEDTIVENCAGEPSDVHSQSLSVEEGNSLLKQQQSDSLLGL